MRVQVFTGRSGAVRLWATRLVPADQAKLDEAERNLVVTLINAAPEIIEAVTLVKAIAAMIRRHDINAFDPWIAAARQNMLRTFAESVQRDRAAIKAALTLPWSTGLSDDERRVLDARSAENGSVTL